MSKKNFRNILEPSSYQKNHVQAIKQNKKITQNHSVHYEPIEYEGIVSPYVNLLLSILKPLHPQTNKKQEFQNFRQIPLTKWARL